MSVIHSQAEVMRQLLVDMGLCTSPDLVPLQAWPVYASGEPGSPDSVVTVFSTVGKRAIREMVGGVVQGPAGFQIRVRSSDQRTARDKMEAIYTALSETLRYRTVTIGSAAYRVQAVVGFGDLLDIGKESPISRRSVVTFNALLVYTKTQ